MDPSILAPSLGNPAFVHVDSIRLEATVLSHFALTLSEGFRLLPADLRGDPIPLTTVSKRGLELEELSAPIRKVVQPSGLAVTRFELEADYGSERFASRFKLYHLDHRDLDLGKNSVCVIRHHWEEVRFLYAADTHVAEMWYDLRALIAAQPKRGSLPGGGTVAADRLLSRESLAENFIDANQNLVALINIANERADAGELDFIVIGGDVVDYVYSRPRRESRESYEDTNINLFVKIVLGECGGKPLRVPLITTTGNHDYRLFPYRLNTYGLRHCGLHNRITRQLLGLGQPVGRVLPTRADIDSVLGRRGSATSLKHYLFRVNPELDFVRDFGGTRLACFDTGRDAFLNARRTHPARWMNLARTTLFGGSDPDSEALSDEQAKLLRASCGAEFPGAVVAVLHSGLFNSVPEFEVQPESFAEAGDAGWLCDEREYELPLTVSDAGDLDGSIGARVKFETRIRDAGLNNGCLFSNQDAVAEVALVPDRPFLALGGHAHREFEVRIDRTSGKLFNRQYSKGRVQASRDGDSYVLTPMALGTVQSKYPVPDFPAFYVVSGGNDGLQLEKQSLCAPPLDSVWFYVRRRAADPRDGVVLELLFGLDEGRLAPEDLRVRIVFCLLSTRPADRGPGAFRVIPVDESVVDQTWAADLTAEDLRTLGARSGKGQILDCRIFRSAVFRLESMVRSSELMIWSEVYSVSANGPQSVRLCLHPRSFSM